MKLATYFIAAVLFVSAAPASAQSENNPSFASATASSSAATAPNASAPNASAYITTRLSTVAFDEPATEEGFATVRVSDASGEAVYRGMLPVLAGARSLDLSAVSVPAAGRYNLRVVYPGGTVMAEIQTPYNLPISAAPDPETVAGR